MSYRKRIVDMEKLKNKLINYDRVIAFLAGEMDAEEQVQFESWLNDSPENRIEFEEIKGIWKITGDTVLNSEVDVDIGWEIVNSQIDNQKKYSLNKKSIFNYRKIIVNVLKIAAVLVLGVFLFNTLRQDPELITISSFDNDKFIHTLPDGTVITLNAWTIIQYPEVFDNDTRRVFISGVAHFEVNPDHKLNFIIDTGDAKVEVLGTSFDLYAYSSSDEIEIEVQTGKVLFYNDLEPGDPLAYKVDLGAGEKAVFSKTTNSIMKSYNRKLWLLKP